MSGGSVRSGSPAVFAAELLLAVDAAEDAEALGDADVAAELPLAPASIFAAGWLELHAASGRTTAATVNIKTWLRLIRISRHPRYRIPINNRTR